MDSNNNEKWMTNQGNKNNQ
jgi:hypothetical protein